MWQQARQAVQAPFLRRKKSALWLRALEEQVGREWLKFGMDSLDTWEVADQRSMKNCRIALRVHLKRKKVNLQKCVIPSKHSRPHVSTEKAERCQTGYLVLKTILKESMIISPLHMEKQMLYLVMQTAIGQVEFWPHALHYIHTHCMGGHPPCELTPVVSFFFLILSLCYFFFIVVDFVIHWNETARVYMCSPSRSPLPPPSPRYPSGSSQCTRSERLSHASNLGWWSVSP